MIPGVVTTTAPNYTVTTSSNTGNYNSVPYPPKHPDLVEFGKQFEILVATIDDPALVKTFYDAALTDYFREKAINFPTWSGLPEIRVNMGIDPLKRSVAIAWYVNIPRAHVVDPDQKEEETLWDS